jgi:4,5-dihydroxyphthalate decarboxylase
MLAEGELDAVIHSSIIKPIVAGDPRVARLFPDYKAEEVAYFRKTGIFPIMHVLGVKQEIVDAHPWVPINMFHAFQKAKTIAMARMANPRIVPLAWYREAWEEQEQILGPDPWEYGLTARNRHTIETLAGYSHEQGLTKRRLGADDLFVSVFQGRKRGDEFRI